MGIYLLVPGYYQRTPEAYYGSTCPCGFSICPLFSMISPFPVFPIAQLSQTQQLSLSYIPYSVHMEIARIVVLLRQAWADHRKTFNRQLAVVITPL